jgi:hypothetical protein
MAFGKPQGESGKEKFKSEFMDWVKTEFKNDVKLQKKLIAAFSDKALVKFVQENTNSYGVIKYELGLSYLKLFHAALQKQFGEPWDEHVPDGFVHLQTGHEPVSNMAQLVPIKAMGGIVPKKASVG